MTARAPKRLFGVISVLVTLVVTLAATAVRADAQTPVEGAADFRNAPLLPPGQFVDEIVTGESVWYALIYTNDTPYRFEVSLPDVDLEADDELTLEARFVGPTFETVGRSGTVVEGSGLRYPSGHTNVWFLVVTLSSSGEENVPYDLVIDVVEGVQDAGLEDCADVAGCTYEADLQRAQAEFDAVQAEFDAAAALEQQVRVEAEISNLTGFLETSESLRPAVEARLKPLEEKMAELCAPEPTCTTFPEQPGKTSVVGLGIGSLALIGGASRAYRRYNAPDEPVEPKPKPKKPPVKPSASSRPKPKPASNTKKKR